MIIAPHVRSILLPMFVISYPWRVASPGAPPPLDLSHVAKLKDVEFRFVRPSVQWIIATLQTAKTKHLRRVTVFSSIRLDKVQEVDRQGWQDLDHLLVQLWSSHSIVPKLKYTKAPERMGVREAAPNLFPELVNRGVEFEVRNFSELVQYLPFPPCSSVE